MSCADCGRSSVELREGAGAALLCLPCHLRRREADPLPAPPARPEEPCEGCGDVAPVEFDLLLDSRVCDECWRAVR